MLCVGAKGGQGSWRTTYRQLIGKHPQHVELWLSYTLLHLDFGASISREPCSCSLLPVREEVCWICHSHLGRSSAGQGHVLMLHQAALGTPHESAMLRCGLLLPMLSALHAMCKG